MNTITVHGSTYAVPDTFDLAAVITAVRSDVEQTFAMCLPPHPHKLRTRRVIFTTGQVDAIAARGLDLPGDVARIEVVA